MPPQLVGVFKKPEAPEFAYRPGNLSTNPNYLLRLKGGKTSNQPDENIEVIANLPENIMIQTRNDWDSLLPRGGGEEAIGRMRGSRSSLTSLIGAGLSVGRVLTGQTASMPVFTAQIWTGTTPLEIAIPLQFDAFEDPLQDVVKPIKDLMRLSMPYEGFTNTPILSGGIQRARDILAGLGVPAGMLTFLHAPGPALWDVFTNNDPLGVRNPPGTISLVLGKHLYFPSVVIIGLDVEQPSRFNDEGWPISMTATITLRSFVVMSREDIDKFIWS